MSIRPGLWIGLLVLNGIVALAAEPQTAKQWHSEAILKEMTGDLRGAIADLDRAIALDPKNWLLYAPRAQDKSELGDLAGAIADFTQIIALVPDDKRRAMFHEKRAHVRSLTGDYSGALADYDQSLKLDEYSDTYNNRGLARNRSGNQAGALEDLDKAISLKPTSPRYLVNRASIRQKQGDLTGAAKDFDRAVEIAPKNYGVYVRRGDFRRSQEDLEGAAADYTKAIEGGSDFAEGYLSRAMIRQAQGKWEAAVADYDLAVKAMEPDSQEPVPYREIALRQLGRGTPPAELAKLATDWEDNWITMTVRFLAGTVSESDLLAHARKDEDQRGQIPQSLALYFAGMFRLQAGDAATARKYFEQHLTLKIPDSIEGTLVRAELARLAKQPPAAPAK